MIINTIWTDLVVLKNLVKDIYHSTKLIVRIHYNIVVSSVKKKQKKD